MITEANQVAFFSGAWERMTWRGVKVFKYPEDLWTYAEIIHGYWPTVIIETGTAQGGGALYFQDLLDGLPKPELPLTRRRVITIDIEHQVATPDPRIHYLLGSSLDPLIVQRVKDLIRPEDRVMVSLDSEHLRDHVLRELGLYAPLVSVGHYLVVEDTFISRRDCRGWRFVDGSSWEALLDWLPKHPEFFVDETRDKHLLSMNPGGWLRRTA